MVTGDTGVGKSRLIAEVLDRCPDMTVGRIQAEPYRMDNPYWALRDPLRRLLGEETGGAELGRRDTELAHLALDTVQAMFERQEGTLAEQVTRANSAVFERSQADRTVSGMGTTLVASLFYDNRVSIAHVGDSRMYRLRGNRFEQITMDHSLLQELVDRGFYSQEEAQRSTNRNYVTRALGVEANVEVEVQEIDVQKGDYFLMCSDGLPDMVEDEDIHLTISTFNNDVRTVGEQLIKLTNDNGGRDNVSVILVRVADAFPAEAGFLRKVRGLFGS